VESLANWTVENMKMNMKQLAMVFAGITLLYAGVLSLADDLAVGVAMTIGGSVLAVIPIWKAFAHSRNLSGGSTGHAVKTGKKKTKRHLKVVKREEEERPTYH
jgi:hypothetical protein